ncbi:MAG TPA: helix-turn-helix transcriptional regulator [Acidimicrobiales bacterium]|nr:helix-turn-helix transcriptional regulator [Acidimicrobiales bacterium]
MIAVPALEPLLPRRGAPPTTAVILGGGGFGKTTALDALAAAYERSGVEVFRIVGRRLEQDEPFAALEALAAATPDASAADVRIAALERLGVGPWLVLVDDAHLLHEKTLTVVSGIADRSGRSGGVVAARRPLNDAALVAFDDVLSAAQRSVVLRPWDAQAITAFALTLGYDAPASAIEAVLVATGGVPALVSALVSGVTEEDTLDVLAAGNAPVPRRLRDAVNREVNLGGASGAAVALALACAIPPKVLSAVTDLSPTDASDALAGLEHAGLVEAGRASLLPAVAAAVAGSASPVEVATLRARAAAVLADSGAPTTEIAPHLAAAGARTEADRRVLAHAAEAIVESDAVTALAWLAAAGFPDDAAGVTAQARLRTGDVAGAAELADRVLMAQTAGQQASAARVAATVAESRGQLRLAADRWALLAEVAESGAHRTSASARAAVMAAALGDAGGAIEAIRAAEQSKPEPAPLAVEAQLEESRGALAACSGDVELGLEHLVRSVALFGSRGEASSVEAAAALVAVAAGRDERARQLASGPSTRQTAVRAWLKLRAGEIAAAEAEIAAVVAHGDVVPRDAILVASVAVGIARRGTDMVRLAAALDMAATVADASDADLMTLPIAGELAAGAVRVARAEAQPMMQRWRSVVERAGAAPVWCAHLHWWRVQWAAAAADADAAVSAASDLSAVAELIPRFAAHAQAGAAWAAILRGDFAAANVGAASDALAEIGLAWEASVIAGAAALRTTEAGAARTLLGKGRDLRARLAVADTAPGGESGEALSEREREVAALVVDGLTHREIGAQLYISAKTVEHHVAHIRQKLGAATRAEMLAALRAVLD